MLSIDQAVKTRWNNKSLTAAIGAVAPGIHQIQVPERTAMPYCVYSTISDLKNIQSIKSRYSSVEVQFQVYDIKPELVQAEAIAIANAFQHSNQAASNPLAIADGSNDYILSAQLRQNYVVTQMSDQVFSCTFTLVMQYGQDGGLRPA